MKPLVLASLMALALAPGFAAAGGGTDAKEKGKGKDKATTLSGCLSGTTDQGVYTLKTKAKDVEVRGSADLKEHVGHEVKLTGSWMDNAPRTGQTEAAGKEQARTDKGADRHLMVTNIEHVAATCTTQQQKPQ